jgi:hypothetical protein
MISTTEDTTDIARGFFSVALVLIGRRFSRCSDWLWAFVYCKNGKLVNPLVYLRVGVSEQNGFRS